MFRIIGLICLSTLLTTNPQRGYSEEPLIGTVTGTVVSESGAPVAGADVLILLDDRPDTITSPKDLLVRGTTDAKGTFAITVPRSLVFNGAIHPRDEIEIWVSHPEKGWTFHRSAGRRPASPLTLTLKQTESQRLTVLTPEGAPAQNAEVSVQVVRVEKQACRVPESLRERFTAVTDKEGRVRLPHVSREEAMIAEFTSEAYGTQAAYWLSAESFSENVILRPTGSVTGQVTGDLPAGRSFDELTVRLSTRPLERDIYFSPPQRQLGIATVRVQTDGTFSVPVLATGLIDIDVQFPQDFPAFASSPAGWYLSAGSQLSVDVPLERARRVTGRAIDAETKQPIPDVRFRFTAGQCRPARTDAQGEFVTYCSASDSHRIDCSPPETYCTPEDLPDDELTIPQGTGDFELPTVEMVPCKTLTGTVKTPNRRPAGGVEVVASWDDRRNSSLRQVSAVSDEQGKFELQGVNPHAPLLVRARSGLVRLGNPVRVTMNKLPGPLEFIADPEERVSLSGKIVDESGRPVPNANYSISTVLDESGNVYYQMEASEVVAIRRYYHQGSEKSHSGRTDADGEFQTPARFLADATYAVVTLVDGRHAGGSAQLNPRLTGTTRFEDVVQKIPPKRESYEPEPPTFVTFTGLVANREGEAIPDAKVVLWALKKRLMLRTDDSGRFQLRDLPKYNVWLFVDAEGYRFFGEHMLPSDDEHRIALIGDDEPAGEPMKTIPDPVDEEVLAKASRELMGFMERCSERGYKGHKHVLMGLMPRLDPELGMKCLEDLRFDASDMNRASSRESHRNRVRWTAANQYVKHDTRKAAEAARLMTLGTDRVSALCSVARQLPEAERELRNELLTDALSTARAIETPRERFEALDVVASTLIDLGQIKRGQIVLHEAIRLARKAIPENLDERLVERADYYRAYLARNLARFDLPAALEMIPAADKEYTICRFYGGLAEEIAEQNPAEALQVFERLPEGRYRNDWAVRVCYRMAKVDYGRARKLSETITSPYLRPYSRGVMAYAIAGKEPEKAKALIAEAYDALGKLADAGERRGSEIHTPLTIAVCLLPVVEQVDSDRLREYFWRTLSYRQTTWRNHILGALLARYDREIGGRLIRRKFDHPPYHVDEWDFVSGSGAVIDPAAAVELVAGLPEKTDDERHIKVRNWDELVEMLSRRGVERWNWLQDRKYSVWRIKDLNL